MRGHMWLNKVASVLGPLRTSEVHISSSKEVTFGAALTRGSARPKGRKC